MSMPKRHHYVPLFLFRRFTAGSTGKRDSVWRLDVKSGRPDKVNPVNEAVEKHLYRVTLSDGSYDLGAEKALSMIEGEAARIVAQLDTCGCVAPAPIDEEWLAMFVHSMHQRTPLARSWHKFFDEHTATEWTRVLLSNPESSRKALIHAGLVATDEEAEEQRLAMLSGLENGEWAFASDSSRQTAWMFIAMEEKIKALLECLTWVLVRAGGDDQFILSDTPLAIVRSAEGDRGMGVGFCSPGAQTTLPLGPQLALLLFPGEPAWMELDADGGLVSEINLRTYAQAQRAIYGPSQGAVQRVRGLAKRRRGLVGQFRPIAPVSWFLDLPTGAGPGQYEFEGFAPDRKPKPLRLFVDPGSVKSDSS